jgi:Bromodomain/Bromodomain extra-terminal - transcription regulation
MDLGKIKKKLASKGFKTLYEVADDIRLVWSNCMAYNADGSDFYILAQTLSEKFEKFFAKILQDHSLVAPASSGASSSHNEVSLEDKRSFAKSLYKLTKDEVGKILVTLDEKCPAALVKNGAEDEVELNVDKISKDVFAELVQFANQCQTNNKGSKAKAKSGPGTSSSTKPVSKKAKTSG